MGLEGLKEVVLPQGRPLLSKSLDSHPECHVLLSQIYVHLKEGGGPDALDALKNKPQLHSMVARSLCRNAAGKNYIIFTGPSITSLTLFEEFEKQGWSSMDPGQV